MMGTRANPRCVRLVLWLGPHAGRTGASDAKSDPGLGPWRGWKPCVGAFMSGESHPGAMKGVMAVDAGTTSVRAVVHGPDGRIHGTARREFTQHYPRPGLVEHDAAEIWTATQAVMREAARAAPGVDVAAIGITDQRETTVLWDPSTGAPAHRAIVWQDRRTATRCRELRPDWQERVQERTGLVLDPYFSATKLEWLLQNAPGAQQKAEAGGLLFGTIDSWLAWNLTGAHVTDVTNVSRTMLWDIHRSDWDPELLELFGIPEAVLPEVVPSGHVVGTTDELGGQVPVASLVGDQQASLFGLGCTRAGDTKNTYGTGCFLLQHTGADAVPSRHGLLTTRAASLDGSARYALEGSVFTGGAAVQWLRDGLKMIDASSAVDARAQEGDDAGGVVVVPAFTGLGAPHWDPDARGAILGLSRGTSRRHIARATLESIAFQCQDVLSAMERESGLPTKALQVDGGAARSDLLLQFQADLLQGPVTRSSGLEGTARGAALLAGITALDWDREAFDGADDGTTFTPEATAEEMAPRLDAWRQAVAAVRAFKPTSAPP